jgi:hypothetical protein
VLPFSTLRVQTRSVANCHGPLGDASPKIAEKTRRHRGDKQGSEGFELRGGPLGIIGYGNIGSGLEHGRGDDAVIVRHLSQATARECKTVRDLRAAEKSNIAKLFVLDATPNMINANLKAMRRQHPDQPQPAVTLSISGERKTISAGPSGGADRRFSDEPEKFGDRLIRS